MTPTTEKPSTAVVELLRALTAAYTRHPTALEVQGADMTAAIVVSLKGHRNDHPKLVGSQGKHIQALRAIFAVIAAKMGRKINITLLEPTQGERGQPTRFEPNPSWNGRPVIDLMERVLRAALPGGFRLNPVRVSDLTTIEVLPAEWSELYEGDFPMALHVIFHAIGKTQGHDIHVNFEREPAKAPLGGLPDARVESRCIPTAYAGDCGHRVNTRPPAETPPQY